MICLTCAGNVFSLGDVKPSDTIEILKAKIHENVGIPPEEQGLIFDGELEDGKTVSDYNIGKNDIIFVIARVQRPSGGQ